MPYGETKVYFDGSHYIAIPHTTRPVRKKFVKPDEIITVEINEGNEGLEINNDPFISSYSENVENVEIAKNDENFDKKPQKMQKIAVKLTKKQFFEQLYKKYIDFSKSKRKAQIINEMLCYFDSKEKCRDFVNLQFERKLRNLICRRVRMIRKANLSNLNYFCTFTYDDKKHTEESFKKKLRTCFRHLCERKKWRYLGVWERAPETKRLHFHGMFEIPDNSMPGELFEKRDYDTNSHKMQTSIQNTYFNERFGRSDFKEINTRTDLMKEISYICKYLEKTEEKIVYSKGLYQYFISDITDDDIICKIGQEDKKLLLYDDFKCWDEGVFVGKVCPQVISEMRKSN